MTTIERPTAPPVTPVDPPPRSTRRSPLSRLSSGHLIVIVVGLVAVLLNYTVLRALDEPGVDVVCSQGGTIPAVLQALGVHGHGVTGLLVEPEPSQLAGAISLLLEDRSLARRLAENAAKIARERYSWPVVYKQYLDVYRAVAD